MPVIPFREHLPSRSTLVPVRTKGWGPYKPQLRSDFKKRCGYCNDIENISRRSFCVDHFVPRNTEGWSHPISDCDYSNLVYACNFCNRQKSDKWPTRNHTIPHINGRGFIDPTSTDYDKLFYRDIDGSIKVNDYGPARYIYDELKLWLAIHSINWRIDKLRASIKKLKDSLAIVVDPESKIELQSQIDELKVILCDLTYNGLFDDN